MTAIGFVLFIMASFGLAAFDDCPHVAIAAPIMLSWIGGIALMVAGIATWIWHVLP